MSNWFISPVGDIILLAVVSVVLGILIQPYVIKLGKVLVALFYKVKDFELRELQKSIFKKLGNHLEFGYYYKEKRVWYTSRNSTIWCDDDNDIRVQIQDAILIIEKDCINEFRQELNKAIRQSNS